MKLKPIIATLCVLGMASAATAMASGNVNAQISQLQNQVNKLQMQVSGLNGGKMSGGSFVSTNAALSWKMLNNYGGSNREMNLLNANLANGLYVGGVGSVTAMYEHVNKVTGTAGNFSHVYSTTTNAAASNIGISTVELNLIAKINSWTTGFVSFGVNNIGNSSASDTNISLNQAYLLMGNLAKSPFYGFAGRKTINFGSFETVNFFTQPLNRTLFQAFGNTVGFGYTAHGLNAVLSLMNGASSNSSDTTKFSNVSTGANRTGINNFALNVNYGMMHNSVNWNVGAGYINGTSAFMRSNDTNGSKRNGAWDINAKVGMAGFNVLAEYTQTSKKANGNGVTSSYVRAWNIGGDYNFPMMGRKSVVSLSYSQANWGSNASNRARQYVLGFRNETFNNVWMGVEYSYGLGVNNVVNSQGVSSNAGAGFGQSSTALTNAAGNVKNNTVLFNVKAVF